MATRTLWLIALSALLTLASQRPASAQAAADAYAQGVNAYFNSGAARAEALLDQAAGAEARNPLVYYFRGLAKLRQGRRHEATEDFRIGAMFEAQRPSGSLGIGRALERVQGGNRLLLEQIRRETREGYEATVVEDLEARYQPTRDRRAQALRSEFRLPLSALTGDSHPDSLADLVVEQAKSQGDPFADEPAGAAPGIAMDASAREPTPIDIPESARGALTVQELVGVFGDIVGSLLPQTPTPPGGFGAGPPAGVGPFGGQPADADPFGDSMGEGDSFGAAPGDFEAAPADGDPFGDQPVQPEVEATDPAADPFADDGGDPFGDGGGDPFGSDAEDPFATDGEDPF